MIMADVLMWFLIAAGAYLAFVSYWLASAALFPVVLHDCARRYARPLAPAVLGFVVLVPLVVIGVVAVKHAWHPAAGALLKAALISLFLPALLGSSGLALRIGNGLSEEGAPVVRRVLRGALVLALMFLPPVLGWFIVLPFVLMSGFGAALLALRASSHARVAAADSPAPAA